MAYNKVDADGRTLIDLTSDTVTADTLVSGRTAHLASGERVVGTFEPVTGVKGNAESTYRKGDVNLTPANLGLGNVNNTSDLDKPISTATQTALNGRVSKTGDTMNGTLLLKNSNIDRDGTVSSTTTGDALLSVRDKDNESIATFAPQQAADGTMRCNINAINEKEDGTAVNNYFQVAVGRDGTPSYNMTSPSAFRSAIGLGNIGYYGIGGRTTNTNTNPWVLVAETTATMGNNNTGITLLFDYTYTPANNATSTGTGILSVSVRTDANGAIVADRSYAKWLTKMNELNDDDVAVTYTNSTKSLQIWAKSDFAYKVFRVRPLSGSNVFSSFDISKWTFTTAVNTNMYASYPTGDEITVLTPTCDIQDQLDDISGELDCLLIQAALVNDEIIIQNTSDFTSELYSKYFSFTKPKFAILKLQITSNTHYYKALINSLSVSQGNLMEASFITLATGEYIYHFTWLRTVTVGTPTVIRKALNLGS